MVFLVWLWRARTNADVYNTVDQVRARGWTIGGWFCPVVNLWFPYQIVRDVWAASLPDEPSRDRWSRVPALVLSWWLCWIGWLVLNQVLEVRLGDPADGGLTAQEAYDANLWDIAETGVLLACTALLLLIVRGLTRLQGQRNAERQSGSPGWL